MYVILSLLGGRGDEFNSRFWHSCHRLQFVKELDLENYIDDVEVRSSLEAVRCTCRFRSVHLPSSLSTDNGLVGFPNLAGGRVKLAPALDRHVDASRNWLLLRKRKPLLQKKMTPTMLQMTMGRKARVDLSVRARRGGRSLL